MSQTSQHSGLPTSAKTLFEAKASKKVTFEEIAQKIGRNEVAVAALFYGQAKASDEDIKNLSEYFGIDHATLEAQMGGFPDRGKSVEMPPKEPLIYRLYEIVQNYGYAYKAVLNEKFGDGIMSAIAFSTKVEKEVDNDGVTWVSCEAMVKVWLTRTGQYPSSWKMVTIHQILDRTIKSSSPSLYRTPDILHWQRLHLSLCLDHSISA